MILWRNDARRGRVVVSACDVAAQLGVRNGIAIAEAYEMALRLSGKEPIVNQHDPIADEAELDRLASILQTEICPLVAIEAVEKRPWAGRVLNQPDTLFCDLSGVIHLFHNEAGLLAAIHRCLTRLGYSGKLAIADNAAAAWAHAHYNRTADVISSDLVNDLTSLSVCGLRIESETKYTLDRLGIETIGALLRLPRAGLARRLGPALVDRLAEITGEFEVPLDAFHAQPDYRGMHELEYATDDLEIITDRISRLLDEITARLSSGGHGVLRLACTLDQTECQAQTTTIGLFAPSQDASHLTGLVTSSIESLRVAAPVCRITITVLQCERMRIQQQPLFADGESMLEGDRVADRSLTRLIDSLSGRLGRDAVLGVRLSSNPLPERAYRTFSLTDYRTRRRFRSLSKQKQASVQSELGDATGFHAQSFHAPARGDARRRPLKLLRSPIRLTLTGPICGKRDRYSQTPPSFKVDRQVHRVVRHWGPERIETGWWEGPTVRRDYYRIETDRGSLWWVFQDLKTGRWFLHGRFC